MTILIAVLAAGGVFALFVTGGTYLVVVYERGKAIVDAK